MEDVDDGEEEGEEVEEDIDVGNRIVKADCSR
jgi:hypothetical protein